MRCRACHSFHKQAASFEHFVRVDPSGCHLWTGSLAGGTERLGRYGYRTVGTKSAGRRIVYAHREAWERKYGPIPPGMVIDHLCRVRNCVNVEHLRVVTQRENLLAEGSQARCKARPA